MNDLIDTISSTLGTETGMDFLPRPPTEELNAKEDYLVARKNMKELIKQGMDSVPMMIHLMQEAQSDKMYTAGAKMLETLSKLNAEMAKLSQEQIKAQPAPATEPAVKSSSDIVFKGNSSEYLRMARERKKQEEVTDVNPEPVEVKP